MASNKQILQYLLSQDNSKNKLYAYWYYSLLYKLTNGFTRFVNSLPSTNSGYGMGGYAGLSSAALHSKPKYDSEINMQENLYSNDKMLYQQAFHGGDYKTQLNIGFHAFKVRMARVQSRTALKKYALETFKFATIYYIAGESKGVNSIKMSNGNWQAYVSLQVKEWGNASWFAKYAPQGYGYKLANNIEKMYDELHKAGIVKPVKPKEQKPKPKMQGDFQTASSNTPFFVIGGLLLLGIGYKYKEKILPKKLLKKLKGR